MIIGGETCYRQLNWEKEHVSNLGVLFSPSYVIRYFRTRSLLIHPFRLGEYGSTYSFLVVVMLVTRQFKMENWQLLLLLLPTRLRCSYPVPQTPGINHPFDHWRKGLCGILGAFLVCGRFMSNPTYVYFLDSIGYDHKCIFTFTNSGFSKPSTGNMTLSDLLDMLL